MLSAMCPGTRLCAVLQIRSSSTGDFKRFAQPPSRDEGAAQELLAALQWSLFAPVG